MSDPSDSKLIDDPAFQSVLVSCLEALQRGETIDREQLASDHPDYAEAIQQFLDDQDLLEQATLQFVPEHLPKSNSDDVQTIANNSTSPVLSAGDTVRYLGDYEILKEIARGGMGVIFKARQQSLKRVVALKMILAGRLASPADVERFQLEARAAGRLKHPNIVPIHEVGEYEGHHYFTMDLVEGRSLAELIRKETLPSKHAAKIVATVAEAVHYAHEKGTLHRDLKPANILIDSDGEPHITDFGLAKLLEVDDDDDREELTASGQVLGTPSYMSPEQASGKTALIGPASDIYSLGAILYSCMAGRAPFVAESTVDTIMQVLKKEPVPPRDLNPSVPRDLNTICLKCLSKEPHRRYGTAKLLTDDLHRFLQGRSVLARPVGPLERGWRWCKRNPLPASLLALLLLAFAGGFAGVTSQWLRAEELARRESLASTRANQQRARANEEAERARRSARQATQAAHESNTYLYATRLTLAKRAWDVGLTNEVSRLLQLTTPRDDEMDRRGLEWHYLDRLIHCSLADLTEGGPISDLAFSREGRLLAVAGGSVVLLWGVDTNQFVQQFELEGIVQQVAFADDDSKLVYVTGSGNLELTNTINAIELTTQEKVKVATSRGLVTQLVVSPDEQFVAAAHQTSPVVLAIQFRRAEEELLTCGEVKVWKLDGGGEVLNVSLKSPRPDSPQALGPALENAPKGLAFSPSGKRLAVVNGRGLVAVWDIKTGRKELEMEGGADAVVFSNDGGTICSAGTTWSADDGRVIARHPQLATWQHAEGTRAAAWSQRTVEMLDLTKGTPQASIRVQDTDGNALAVSPDGWRVATSAMSGTHIWDSCTNQEALVLLHPPQGPSPHYARVVDAVISPDGTKIATVVNGLGGLIASKIRLWDRTTGKELLEIAGSPMGCRQLAFDTTGKLLAVVYRASQGVVIYDAYSGRKLHHWKGEGEPLSFSSDGRLVATVASGKSGQDLVIRTASDGTLVRRHPLKWNSISFIAFNASSTQLIFAGHQNWIDPRSDEYKTTPYDLGIYDPGSDRVVTKGPAPCVRITDLATGTKDEQLAIASPNKTYILDTSDFSLLHTLELGGQPVAFSHVAFSPDGRRILIGKDSQIHVYDLASHQELLRLEGASTGLSFDSRGDFLVAGGVRESYPTSSSASGVAMVWDLRPSKHTTQEERVASSVVRYVAGIASSLQQGREHIEADNTISDASREIALQLWDNYTQAATQAESPHEPTQ